MLARAAYLHRPARLAGGDRQPVSPPGHPARMRRLPPPPAPDRPAAGQSSAAARHAACHKRQARRGARCGAEGRQRGRVCIGSEQVAHQRLHIGRALRDSATPRTARRTATAGEGWQWRLGSSEGPLHQACRRIGQKTRRSTFCAGPLRTRCAVRPQAGTARLPFGLPRPT